jgi:hypothetical protein
MIHKKTDSPSMIRIVIALWFWPGATVEEISVVAHVGEATTASYMRHLLDDDKVHISGWRDSKKFHGIYTREYSAGPQIGPIHDKPVNREAVEIQPPRFVRHDPIYEALSGI